VAIIQTTLLDFFLLPFQIGIPVFGVSNALVAVAVTNSGRRVPTPALYSASLPYSSVTCSSRSNIPRESVSEHQSGSANRLMFGRLLSEVELVGESGPKLECCVVDEVGESGGNGESGESERGGKSDCCEVLGEMGLGNFIRPVNTSCFFFPNVK
jgi:hypothetical protein